METKFYPKCTFFSCARTLWKDKETVEGEPHAGKPVTKRSENMERVWDLIRCDQ
jgi:hypothetical protein